ncbi:hypothetical protein KJ671_00180 [Patescibacteria group bacterium]|nr:hypothetical protein [Patescibacteria group bacterium]
MKAMKVILIAGVESFLVKKLPIISDLGTGCLSFYSYLRKKVHLFEKKIFFYDGRDVLRLKTKRLLRKIEKIIAMNPSEPLVIYFDGHGLKGEWCLYVKNKTGGFSLRYRKLIKVLKKQRGPLIIIADCCYAMDLEKQLEKLSCEWLLLGAAPKDRVGHYDVSEQFTTSYGVIIQIVKDWLKHSPANPKYNPEKAGVAPIRYIKEKIYSKTEYVLLYDSKKNIFKKSYLPCFHKTKKKVMGAPYYVQSYDKIKIVLRAGDNIDHLLYPKVKKRKKKTKKKKRFKKKK